jgi:hypothetical protein
MVSAVRSRPNHYEVLGLSPGASQQDITQAFAKAMSMFGARPMTAAAQISLAFEVLRNPAKRRDYDRSIGLAPEPKPQPQPRLHQWSMAAPPPRWAPFGTSPAPKPVAQPVPAQLRTEAPAEPAVASSIAASLRELAEPTFTPRPPTAPALQELEETPEAAERPFDWRRPALAVGGLLVAAGLIGTYAGLSVRDNGSSAEAEPGVTVALPKAKATVAAAPASDAAPVFATSAQPRTRAEVRAPPVRHAVAAQEPDSTPEQQVDATAAPVTAAEVTPAADQASAPATGQTAADPLAPKPTAVETSLPLPNTVVARTIERIGYSCGTVASASAVAGGVFKVTCSSGQTYRAAPVHGRYHFKRWSD